MEAFNHALTHGKLSTKLYLELEKKRGMKRFFVVFFDEVRPLPFGQDQMKKKPEK